MCGIVGAAAQRNIVPVLIEGLRRLEYRGYDSCGVAVLGEGGPARARSVARVADLDEQVRESQLGGITGLAHTRWATHGAPVTDNAHPMFSRETIALVHNGIIENHEALRKDLIAQGYEFVSQTDSEVIAHLIHRFLAEEEYEQSGECEATPYKPLKIALASAVRATVQQLRGAYAITVFNSAEPQCIVGARHGSPLVIGIGNSEHFFA